VPGGLRLRALVGFALPGPWMVSHPRWWLAVCSPDVGSKLSRTTILIFGTGLGAAFVISQIAAIVLFRTSRPAQNNAASSMPEAEGVEER
jgi:hypothetical protein